LTSDSQQRLLSGSIVSIPAQNDSKSRLANYDTTTTDYVLIVSVID